MLLWGKIFFFLLLSYIQLEAQSKQIDSVRNLLPTLSGKERLTALYFLSNKLEDTFPKEAQGYGLEGIRIAEQTGDSASLATLHSSLAYSSCELGNFEQSLKHAYQSLEISTKINDKKRIASANSVLGITYVFIGQYSRALEHHKTALHLREELGLIVPTANTLNNIGIAYHHIGQYDKAIEYYKRAWDIHRSTLTNMTKVRYLTNIGYSEFKRGDFAAAMRYHNDALAIAKELNYIGSLAYIYFNLGIMHENKQEYQQALEYLQLSLNYYDSLGQKYGSLQLLNAIAKTYYQTKQYQNALHYLDQALTLSKQIRALDQLKLSYETLFLIYNITGPLSKAYHYFQLYAQTKDSLMNSSESNKIADLSIQFATIKNQREIELLKKEKMISELNLERENTRSYMLYSGIFISVFITALLYYNYRRIQNHKNTVETINKELTAANDELQVKMSEIKLLTGLLPICSNCKKIRDDKGEWERLEKYITTHSGATFTHGICPECAKELYGNVLKKYEEH